jgi:type IV pilus assembly protein PilB
MIGELLVEAGLVRRSDLETALEEQRLRGGRLCYHLMRLGKVTPGALFLFLQENFGIIAPDLLEILRNSPETGLLPGRLAHFYQMVPLRRDGGVLLLAMAHVDNPNLIPAVEELTGLRVEPVICPPGLIRESLARFFQSEDEPGVVRSALEDSVLVLSDPAGEISPVQPETLPESASGVVWLRALIGEAIRRRSREILLEPLEEESRLTFRQPEGEDSTRAVSRQVHLVLAMALEDLSKMSARGRTVPREGRFRVRHGDRHVAALLTWLPGIHGDAYHLRMVEERLRKQGLEEMLEDYPEARQALDRALAERRGLLLVAAPEGHFRERVVSALVHWIRWQAGRTIFLGGPDGDAFPGIEVRDPGGPGAAPLAETIAAAAREGPDFLAVLRIQSIEEAAALMEAARSRMAVAGVGGQDALDAFQWLLRGGLLPQLRSGGLCGILGMRMAERICEHCRRRYDLLEEFPNLVASPGDGGLYFANTGCRACRGAGVLDLEAAFEFFPMNAALAERVEVSVAPEAMRKEWARTGTKSLYKSMLARAAAGEIDVREPLRLLMVEGRGAA